MTATAETFFGEYFARLKRCMELVPVERVAQVAEKLVAAYRQGRQVFVLGNGGSAATASHIACDLLKVTAPGEGNRQHALRIMALTDNAALITALANDISYEAIFSEQLKAWVEPGDLVIAISASGNSPNVLAGLQTARAMGAYTIGFLGFGGGKARELVDLPVIVPSDEYGPVEDLHLVFDHMLTAYVKRVLAAETGQAAVPAIQAVVLAAGKGTRLHPLTLHRPKPMLPVAGQPLLEHTLNWLKRYGVEDIAINLHYKPEAVRTHLGDGQEFGVRLTYSHEKTLRGTAGAVRQLRPFLRQAPFVVVYGDVLTDLDLRALLAFHAESVRRDPTTGVTMSLHHVPNPTEVGLVELAPDCRVTRFAEKPRPEEVFGSLASAGVLVVEPRVIDLVPPEEFYDFGLHLFPQLLNAGVSIYGWEIPDQSYLLDIGTPEQYAQAQREWPIRQRMSASELIPS